MPINIAGDTRKAAFQHGLLEFRNIGARFCVHQLPFTNVTAVGVGRRARSLRAAQRLTGVRHAGRMKLCSVSFSERAPPARPTLNSRALCWSRRRGTLRRSIIFFARNLRCRQLAVKERCPHIR